jgi:predicted O-methyltransferase YrrM
MPIIRSQPRFSRMTWLASFAYTVCSGLIRPEQKPSEIVRLLKHLQNRPPGRLLEIGTAEGGTLFMLTRVARDDATIVSLSLPDTPEVEEPRLALFRSFALPAQELSLLRRDSHDLATRDEVVRLIGDQGLDFLFIDGDHSYAGAKQDFELYAPLVRPGGLVALHDIVRHPPELQCYVHDFWREIRRDHESWEIVHGRRPRWGGIGVIRL